jgi:hypothetical protein
LKNVWCRIWVFASILCEVVCCVWRVHFTHLQWWSLVVCFKFSLWQMILFMICFMEKLKDHHQHFIIHKDTIGCFFVTYVGWFGWLVASRLCVLGNLVLLILSWCL